MTRELITANHAAGHAATLAGRANRTGRGFGSGVYPITPQTECIEYLCKQEIERGHVIRVESEHSAMAACIGFSVGGARTFTASSSNGLAYMVENVFTAAFFRLPVVMMAVNRIQLYCEDNQEVFDSVLAAYRLAEDRRVLLPVMVNQDAFVLSHTMMMTDLPDQEQVDRFLPVLDLPHRVTDVPRTVGGLDFPHETEVHREQHAAAMARVPEVYGEVQAAFAAEFGRELADPVVSYRMEDADVALVTMGTLGATARQAVDTARERGIRAGSVRVRMFRPFPETELKQALGHVDRVAIVDRDLSPGMGGILWSEARGCLGGLVQGYMIGLGGGDVLPSHLGDLIDDVIQREMAGTPGIVEVA
jgi:pyruvate/2-oxoacid:ferredoxin oxidoreductase alpha subunit